MKPIAVGANDYGFAIQNVITSNVSEETSDSHFHSRTIFSAEGDEVIPAVFLSLLDLVGIPSFDIFLRKRVKNPVPLLI